MQKIQKYKNTKIQKYKNTKIQKSILLLEIYNIDFYFV